MSEVQRKIDEVRAILAGVGRDWDEIQAYRDMPDWLRPDIQPRREFIERAAKDVIDDLEDFEDILGTNPDLAERLTRRYTGHEKLLAAHRMQVEMVKDSLLTDSRRDQDLADALAPHAQAAGAKFWSKGKYRRFYFGSGQHDYLYIQGGKLDIPGRLRGAYTLAAAQAVLNKLNPLVQRFRAEWEAGLPEVFKQASARPARVASRWLARPVANLCRARV